MKYYFYSKIPAFLKGNDKFLGVVNKNLSYVNFEKSPFIEFIPTLSNYNPSYYYDYYKTNVLSFNLQEGNLLIPIFTKKPKCDYKILSQQRFDFINLTVVLDGNVKFYIDGDICASDEIPFIPTFCNVIKNNEYITATFTNTETAVFIYDLNGSLIFKEVVSDFEILQNGNILFSKTSKGLVRVTVQNEIDLSNCPQIVNSQILSPLNSLNPYLLPYAFLELVKLKYDISSLLSPSILNRKNDLLSFIGNITTVIPSLTFKENEVLVVDGNSLKKFTFEINSRLITNLLIDDYWQIQFCVLFSF